MRNMMDVRHRRGNYFQPHPLHGTYALIASMALAGLIAIAIVIAVAR